MPGSTFQPLGTKGEYQDGVFVVHEDSEFARFRKAAIEGDPIEELIGLTMTSTGLRAAEMAHMRWERWLKGEINQGRPNIKVPYADICLVGGGEATKGSEGGNTIDIEPGVCYDCNNRGHGDWVPSWAEFSPKTENSAGRTIPVRDGETIKILKSYFEVFEKVCSPNHVTRLVKKIADRAGILKETPYSEYRSHWPTAHNLRETYGTILAKRDAGAHRIQVLMGHQNIQTSQDYIDLAGRDVQEYYDEHWPNNEEQLYG